VQTATGALLSITPGGGEILDERGAISNLGVTVNGAESLRAVASNNAQTSFAAGLTQTQSAGESYGAALRQMMDFSHQQGANQSSGESSTHSQTSGLSQSAQDVSQLVKSFAQDHHVNHERAAQVLGQVYADAKIGSNAFIKTGVGVSGSLSGSARSSFGGLFAEAERFAQDHHFSDTVDKAQREAQEVHYRQGADEGSRLANSISSSFDKANHYRDEATSQFSKSQSYSSLASTSTEQSASINANYTQEFYEWMRTQSSPLGNEKMSPSAIDNMGAHDLALLQGYATDFVNEKTAREIVKFEASHGITQGDAAIKAVHQHNSHFVNNAVSSGFARNNQSVNEAIEHASQLGQGIGHVNDNVNNQVNQSIESNQQRLDSQKAGTHDRGAHVTDKVNKTVEGQVIGSLDIPDKAKAMVSSAMNKFTKETVDE